MENNILGRDIKTRVSLEPLLEFWEKNLTDDCEHMKDLFRHIEARLDETPALRGDIEDMGILNEHYDIIRPLMSAVFPAATFQNEIAGALAPCTFAPFFVSPEFQRIFIDNDNFINTLVAPPSKTEIANKRLKIYQLVLERIYGLTCRRLKSVDIKALPDSTTGLTRYYGITADFQFIRIRPLAPPPALTEAEKQHILDNFTKLEILREYIDLSQYEFSGFTLVRAMDVTETQVISDLERDLIDHHSIFSSEGIGLLEKRLRTLFQNPNLFMGIGAVRGDQVMIIKSDCGATNCLFSNSKHMPISDLEGTIWTRAALGKKMVKIGDLAQKKDILPAEEQAVSAGIRSIIISPLTYQGNAMGILEIFCATPNELGPMDAKLLEQVTPIFSVALKRGIDEMDKHVQSIIKKQCTAVHPSVEWRFEQAAIRHMESTRRGDTTSEMEPIIFKDVIPFYGQSDIRGSSQARNEGIQKDLDRQLSLALDIMTAGENLRPWPIFKEYKHLIQKRMERISKGITSGDEQGVFTLLNREIASSFDELKHLGPQVAKKIEIYEAALDPAMGMIYDKRRDYEESVSTLNQTLSAFIDQEDGLVQKDFPHYFEKRQTDGVDYMMYIGAAMNEKGYLAPFHIQDMTLWQIILACGLAWQTEQLKPRLKVPLDTCHMILVNHTPLSIRFRFDEKRFDVDGAYDVRQEIIKSRLDKALVRNTGERLTQPGKISMVFSTPAEGRKIRRHIEFLTAMGKLHNDMELLELDDIPDIRGLKALRVGVDLDGVQHSNIIEMKAG